MSKVKTLPCPFCGSIPKVMHGKLTHCSLHGDPAQEIIVKCSNNDCVVNPRVSAGDIYNGGLDLAKQAAIERWNIRHSAGVIASSESKKVYDNSVHFKNIMDMAINADSSKIINYLCENELYEETVQPQEPVDETNKELLCKHWVDACLHCKEKYLELEAQNKRYREALEEITESDDEGNILNTQHDMKQIAREALNAAEGK